MRRLSSQRPGPGNRKGQTRHAHGYVRASDTSARSTEPDAAPPRPTPPGTPMLMLLAVGLLCAVGIARVHTRTRILEIGAEISVLTSEQASLLDDRRRLEAERAYLRHPDQVRETASNHLGMVPLRPDRVQSIELSGDQP